MTVNVKKFLTEVEAIASEEPAYKLGHYGQDGLCDCIGLIIGAIRRAGGEWRGTHGSNYAARKEVVALHPIYGSGELQPGEVVFKAMNRIRAAIIFQLNIFPEANPTRVTSGIIIMLE